MPSKPAQRLLARGVKLTKAQRACYGKRCHSERSAKAEAQTLRNCHSSRFAAYPCRTQEHASRNVWHVGRKSL